MAAGLRLLLRDLGESEWRSEPGLMASLKNLNANHSRYAAPPQRMISSTNGAFSTRAPTPAVPAVIRKMSEIMHARITAVMPSRRMPCLMM